MLVRNNAAGFAAHRCALIHLLEVVRTLSRADTAVLILVHHDRAQILAQSGKCLGNISYHWPIAAAPFRPNENVIISGMELDKIGQIARFFSSETEGGVFVRLSVLATQSYYIKLLTYVPKNKVKPSKEEMQILKNLVKSLSKTLRDVTDHLLDSDSQVPIIYNFEEIMNIVNDNQSGRELLDRNFVVLAMSNATAKIYGKINSDLIGKPHSEIRPSLHPTLARLYRKALETGFSTPEMDISIDHSGSLRTYRVRCSPIRPLGYPEDILDITSEDVTHKVVPQTEHSQLSDGFGEPSSNFIEPTGSFLFETLVSKRALRQRGSLNYLTIRSWRNSIKEHQIKAMRAIKQSAHFDFASKCAKECAAEIVSLVGVNTYKFVIPIPCGHSKPGKCLSLSLAKAIGAELSLPVIDAFAHQPLKGTSHPKTNLKRPPLRLTQHVPGPAILVDDVATSGAHLEEAATLLRSAGVDVFALAWIGGDAA